MEKSKLNIIMIISALIIFIIVVVLVVFLTNQTYFASDMSKGKLVINNKTLNVELAETPEQIVAGLSSRKYLKENQGMLFVFPDKRYRNFWMKDMKFPLDIVWIDDNKIVGISANAPVPAPEESNLPIYRSTTEVNYVLELNAGVAEKFGFNVGDEVKILNK